MALAMAGGAGLLVAAVQANMSHRLSADQFVVGLGAQRAGARASSASWPVEIEPNSTVVEPGRDPASSPTIPLSGRRCSTSRGCSTSSTRSSRSSGGCCTAPGGASRSGRSARTPTRPTCPALHVNKLRRQTIYLTGMTAGIGGGYFLFARSGRFEDSLIGGRGYIAIAAVIFGGWTLKGTVAGCLAFGLVGSFVLTIPSLGYESIDPAFLAMAPGRGHHRGDDGLRQARAPAGRAGPTVRPRPEVKAVRYDHAGGTEVLEYVDVPDPDRPGGLDVRRARRGVRARTASTSSSATAGTRCPASRTRTSPAWTSPARSSTVGDDVTSVSTWATGS